MSSPDRKCSILRNSCRPQGNSLFGCLPLLEGRGREWKKPDGMKAKWRSGGEAKSRATFKPISQPASPKAELTALQPRRKAPNESSREREEGRHNFPQLQSSRAIYETVAISALTTTTTKTTTDRARPPSTFAKENSAAEGATRLLDIKRGRGKRDI